MKMEDKVKILEEKLRSKLENSEKKFDMETIQKAYEIAKTAHEGQFRDSGDPYIIHPLEVASIVVDLGMDSESVEAALLHDVVEDTDVTLPQIEKQFGKEVALLIDGVTKLGRIPYSSREEQQAENVRKMLIAMADDIRVIIIKLADRLHNMRTIQYRPEQKRRDTALETMEVYAPIAHRLGIRAVKEELEDISIRCLDPVAYKEIEDALNLRKNEREKFIVSIKQRIFDRVSPMIPNVYLEGRVKSINGIYRKMYAQNHSFDEIYDIYAVRVIVDTVNDCYNVLGVIHDMFQPLPNRFKDYISTPKPNMYQSLHTTVISKECIPFEVQIRTWDMHHTAEYGIAAHWKYKLGLSDGKMEDRIAWVRQLLEQQAESGDATDILRSIKSDIAPEEVFVFTPNGDVISLPQGSTVIDFAYAIHSAVGNRMIGAKVDSRIVPIDYQVKTGEIIEILTTKEVVNGPSRDWLKIVKTSEARSKIRAWFKKEKREENIEQGKDELEKEFRRNGILLPEEEMQELLSTLAKRQHCNTIPDFYAAIGYGGVQLWRIIPRIKEEIQKRQKEAQAVQNDERILQNEQLHQPVQERKDSGGVYVDGIDNCLIKFSRCCNPLPGDDIIGFVTRGFGVSIHKRSCVNVPENIAESSEPERWVKVRWAENVQEEFKATLEIVAANRQGLLADITSHLTNMHLMIHSLNSREAKDGNAIIYANITVKGRNHIDSIIAKLKNIQGIVSITRT